MSKWNVLTPEQKAEKLAYRREYYAKNKERYKERYCMKKEKTRTHSREYYQKYIKPARELIKQSKNTQNDSNS